MDAHANIPREHASSKYLAGPGDLVFEEAASTIVDQNNKKIISW
jgi:hypothetical protein